MRRLTSPCSCDTPLASSGDREAEGRHVEGWMIAVARQHAEREQIVHRDVVTIAPRVDVTTEEIAGEPIDAGGHRRVCREQRERPDRRDARG